MKKVLASVFITILFITSCNWNKCIKEVYGPDEIVEVISTLPSISSNYTLHFLMKCPASFYYDGNFYNFENNIFNAGGSCSNINNSVSFVNHQTFALDDIFNIEVLKGEKTNNYFRGVLENDTFFLELKLNPKFIGLFSINLGGGAHPFDTKIDIDFKDRKCNHYYYGYKNKYWIDNDTREITNNFDLYYNSPYFFPEIQPGFNITYESQKEFFKRYYFINITN